MSLQNENLHSTKEYISIEEKIKTYNFERKIYFEKILKIDKLDKFVIKNQLKKEFNAPEKWPNSILQIILLEDCNVKNRLILSLFFKFNSCTYSLAIKIIEVYSGKKLLKDKRDRFSYLWHKTLNIETNKQILTKYYYYDINKRKLLFLNGKGKPTKIIVVMT